MLQCDSTSISITDLENFVVYNEIHVNDSLLIIVQYMENTYTCISILKN